MALLVQAGLIDVVAQKKQRAGPGTIISRDPSHRIEKGLAVVWPRLTGITDRVEDVRWRAKRHR